MTVKYSFAVRVCCWDTCLVIINYDLAFVEVMESARVRIWEYFLYPRKMMQKNVNNQTTRAIRRVLVTPAPESASSPLAAGEEGAPSQCSPRDAAMSERWKLVDGFNCSSGVDN